MGKLEYVVFVRDLENYEVLSRYNEPKDAMIEKERIKPLYVGEPNTWVGVDAVFKKPPTEKQLADSMKFDKLTDKMGAVNGAD